MDAKDKALSAIRQKKLLSKGASVVVGLSGGADSVALLHILLSLKTELSLGEIVAVHVNHGLRGEEAEQDSCFVADLCQQWNVPLHTFCEDVNGFAKEQKIGLEEAGRILRYRFFEDVRSLLENAVIATAHTASDNAETVLLHLCRGSGIRGVCGIPAKRQMVVRPLIDCTRTEIEEYCAAQKLTFVVDSSNLDESFSRNRVRLQAIPALQKINPKTEEALCRFSNQAQVVYDYMDSLAEETEQKARLDTDQYSREFLLSLPKALLYFTLQRLLGQCEEKHLRLAEEMLKNGGAVSLGDKRFVVLKNTVNIELISEKLSPFTYNIALGKAYSIGEFVYRIKRYTYKEYEQKLKNNKNIFKNAFDYDKINGTLVLRQRRAGDAYHPAGRGCGKTLKKLLNENKISARDALPVLCDESGIVLVLDCGCDERVNVSSSTAYVAVLEKEEDV